MAPVRLWKRHKFNAKAVTIDEHKFPSQAEAKRYGELRLLEKAGEISELELQPSFPLTAASTTGTVSGALRAASDRVLGVYRADFSYRDKQERLIVEDVKGFKTPLYRWKKKHVEAQYGIRIVEIGR